MHSLYAILMCPLALAAVAAPSPPNELLAEAAAKAAGSPFKITHVSSSGYDVSTSSAAAAEADKAKERFNSLTFTVFDPDPKGNASSTSCTLRWAAADKPTDSYAECRDTTFNARVGGQSSSTFQSKGWKGAGEFGVSVSHGVRDDSLGPEPYNHRRTFAQANFGNTTLVCSKSGDASGVKTCKLKAGKQVTMTVVGVSA